MLGGLAGLIDGRVDRFVDGGDKFVRDLLDQRAVGGGGDLGGDGVGLRVHLVDDLRLLRVLGGQCHQLRGEVRGNFDHGVVGAVENAEVRVRLRGEDPLDLVVFLERVDDLAADVDGFPPEGDGLVVVDDRDGDVFGVVVDVPAGLNIDPRIQRGQNRNADEDDQRNDVFSYARDVKLKNLDDVVYIHVFSLSKAFSPKNSRNRRTLTLFILHLVREVNRHSRKCRVRKNGQKRAAFFGGEKCGGRLRFAGGGAIIQLQKVDIRSRRRIESQTFQDRSIAPVCEVSAFFIFSAASLSKGGMKK